MDKLQLKILNILNIRVGAYLLLINRLRDARHQLNWFELTKFKLLLVNGGKGFLVCNLDYQKPLRIYGAQL